MKIQSEHPPLQAKSVLRFAICSIAGTLLFLIPLPIRGKSDLLVAASADYLTGLLAPALPWILTAFFTAGALVSLVHFIWPVAFWERSSLLRESFSMSLPKLLARIFGAAFFAMNALQIGPACIISPATGGTMYSLMLSLAVWHLMSFYLFSLLMDFGSMDFIGTLIQRIMRPLFTLPGCAAIDCMASWVGNGPFGVIITKMQYQTGYYTRRESAAVASCFSIVSVSFCVIVAKTLHIMDYFGPYYLSITVSTILCAVILPRIWPLKNVPDTYCPDTPAQCDIPAGNGTLGRAAACAAKKAGEARLRPILRRSSQTALDFFLGVFPVMMACGTLMLIVSEYTPVIRWLAIPWEHLLSALRVPEAAAAAPALLVGFVDMYLPAVAGSTISSDVTRFIIGSVSIGQLIYMTETGAIILKNRDIFGLSFPRLAAVFLLRTVISLAAALCFASLLF